MIDISGHKKENENVQSNESGIQEDWKKDFKRCKKNSNSNSSVG